MSHFPHNLLKHLASQILAVERPHPIRVAIDGVDAAGKTTLADELVDYVQAHNRPVIRASVDGFNNPRAVRYRQGRLSAEGYFNDSFDYGAVIANLLEPLGPDGNLRYRTAAFDYMTDTAVNAPEQTTPANALLLIDGIFLLRPELITYWDYKIFVDVEFSVSVRRGLERHQKRFGTIEGVVEQYEKRYIPGQRLYLESCQPQAKADIVVENFLDSPA